MDLVQHIKTFFKKHSDSTKPMILGYSGGTDSSVLFELLLEAKIPFIAAHVDHGWRETSAKEAQILAERAAAFKIPFYTIRLDLTGVKGNLEEVCREKRYAYFKELSEQFNTDRICLAHHRDDQVETTLTRLLQGYSLYHLSGMTANAHIHGLQVLRPLLEIPKKMISTYPLKFPAIEDATNHDTQFLRARLRTLQEGLRKEIEGPLTRISKEASELKLFLSQQLDYVLKTIVPICCGSRLDLSPYKLSRYEYRFVLREFLRKQNAIFSHHLIESALEALESSRANYTVQGNGVRLYVDRKQLFLEDRVPKFDWVEAEGPELLGWEPFLRGELTVPMDEGLKMIPCKKHFSDLWNSCHVPAFLRGWAPMLQTSSGELIELLTGRPSKQNGQKFIRFSML